MVSIIALKVAGSEQAFCVSLFEAPAVTYRLGKYLSSVLLRDKQAFEYKADEFREPQCTRVHEDRRNLSSAVIGRKIAMPFGYN